MSWSASFRVDENGSVVEESVTEWNIEPDHHNDQYTVALDCVWNILREGVVGKGKEFQVKIDGHGNENHEPVLGWSNDFISINIYQK